MELDTTMRALQALEALGKCVIVHGDSEDSLVSALVLVPSGAGNTYFYMFLLSSAYELSNHVHADVNTVQGVKFAM